MRFLMEGILFAFAALFLWGIHGPAGRYLSINGVDTFFITATRFWLGTIVFAIFIAIKKLKVSFRFSKDSLYIIKIAFIGIFLNSILYHLTLRYLPGTLVMLLENTSPIFVILFASIFQKDKPKWFEIVSLIFSIGGVVLVVMGKDGNGSAEYMKGILLGLLTGLTFGYYVYASAGYVTRYREDPDKIIIFLFKLMLISSILLSPIYLKVKGLPDNSKEWFWLVEMGVFQSGFAYLFWNYSLAKLPVKTTSLLFVFTIFFTTINESIFLGLQLNPYLIGGGILIILSGLTIGYFGRRKV